MMARLFILAGFAAGGTEAFPLCKGFLADIGVSVNVAGCFQRGNGFQQHRFRCRGVGSLVCVGVAQHEKRVEAAVTQQLAVMRRGDAVVHEGAAADDAQLNDFIAEGLSEVEPGKQKIFLGLKTANGTFGLPVFSLCHGMGCRQALIRQDVQGNGSVFSILIRQNKTGQVGDTRADGFGGLNRLVHQNIADRRDITHVLSSLGGVQCRPDSTDAAFAAFLTALMQAVWHHD